MNSGMSRTSLGRTPSTFHLLDRTSTHYPSIDEIGEPADYLRELLTVVTNPMA